MGMYSIYLVFALLLSDFISMFLNAESASENPMRDDNIKEAMFDAFQNTSLAVFTVKTLNVSNPTQCIFECLEHSSCVSVNYKKEGNPGHLCELCNQTIKSRPQCKRNGPEYTHFEPHFKEPFNPCYGSPCKNGGTCVANDCGLSILYRCVCDSFNTGKHCDQWSVPIASCNDIYKKTSYREDKFYTWFIDGKHTDIYCHMSAISGCGDGGWTLVIKADGLKRTFKYSSPYWSNKIAYNLSAGQTGFDNYETKLPSYWSVPFQRICVGFRVSSTTKYTVISYSATSLYDVIADGKERYLSISKATWEGLIEGSFIQTGSQKKGFNRKGSTRGKLRLGIVGDNNSWLKTPDSFIGFGQEAIGSCSAVVHGHCCTFSRYCKNQELKLAAFGYLLVK